MPTNNYGDIDGGTAANLEKEALEHVKPFQVLEHGAKKLKHPRNSTKVTKLRQAIPFAAATTPLSEGVPPAGTQVRYINVDIAMKQYGGYVPITDVVIDLHTTPVLSDANKLNAEQVAKTREALIWNMLKANPNVRYANGVSSLATVVGVLTKAEQSKAVRSLQRNKAKKFTQIVVGGVKQSTKAIEAAYICFVHTDAEAHIRAMGDFVPVSKYGSQTVITEHEFGAVDNVRYISSPDLDPQLDAGGTAGTNVSANGSKSDVYSAVYCGMDAYAIVELNGKGAIEPRVRNVGKPTKSDPLGQTGSVGWIMWTAHGMINSDWAVTVKHTVTD